MFYQIFILLFLFSNHIVMAKNFFAEKELKEIDSLIIYNHFEIAEKRTEILSKKLQNNKKNKEHFLETKFRQALILDKKNESPAKQLQLLLKIKDEAETENLFPLMYRIYLLIALSHEKSNNFDLTKKYLDKAFATYKKHRLDSIFSTYCIRNSSYLRFINESDSSFYYAKKANEFAKKYDNEEDLIDSYILLGNFEFRKENYLESLKYYYLLLDYIKSLNKYLIGVGYNNISRVYLKMQDIPKALLYNDSAYIYYEEQTLMYRNYFPETRYKIYEEMGKTDSAFYYFKQYHTDFEALKKEEELVKTKELEEQYQNDKKEATIKSKQQQILLIIGLLVVIACSLVMLYFKNRKINKQNKIIGEQLIELTKTIEQKEVLLSELQHRVKNNLQHVISILEIQKESVDFNNIDELIRGNQNRIHSMALLHNKLNIADNVADVNLKQYITELAELVRDSYDNIKQEIHLDIKCKIENISIKKALPLGLIIVELVSNSIKHAFKKQHNRIINIEITKEETMKLYYADNGIGFDFNKLNKKGLGQEIIKGLIDQIDGKIETKNNNGFELIIYFV